MDTVNVSSASSVGTPLWITVVGWGITLTAALIPCFFNWRKGKSLEKDIKNLRGAKAHHVNYLNFLDQRGSIISKLQILADALELGNSGIETISRIERLIIKVDAFSKELKFSSKDQEIISSVLESINMIRAEQLFGSNVLRSADLEKIILILQKGENSI